MLSDKHLNNLQRILVEICFSEGSSPAWVAIAGQKNRLVTFLEQVEDSAGPAVSTDWSRDDLELLASAVQVVKDERGGDDLFIRAGIAPTDCEGLIEALHADARDRAS
jgi:hypothetical protein